jgi:hypothetical protein
MVAEEKSNSSKSTWMPLKFSVSVIFTSLITSFTTLLMIKFMECEEVLTSYLESVQVYINTDFMEYSNLSSFLKKN